MRIRQFICLWVCTVAMVFSSVGIAAFESEPPSSPEKSAHFLLKTYDLVATGTFNEQMIDVAKAAVVAGKHEIDAKFFLQELFKGNVPEKSIVVKLDPKQVTITAEIAHLKLERLNLEAKYESTQDPQIRSQLQAELEKNMRRSEKLKGQLGKTVASWHGKVTIEVNRVYLLYGRLDVDRDTLVLGDDTKLVQIENKKELLNALKMHSQ